MESSGEAIVLSFIVNQSTRQYVPAVQWMNERQVWQRHETGGADAKCVD
jgi:hypothetical protein